MSFKKSLYAASIAIGIGLNGLLGVGVTVADAAPTAGHGSLATTKETPEPQPVPGVKLNHHDQKKLKKYLKEHPEVTVPNAGQN